MNLCCHSDIHMDNAHLFLIVNAPGNGNSRHDTSGFGRANTLWNKILEPHAHEFDKFLLFGSRWAQLSWLFTSLVVFFKWVCTHVLLEGACVWACVWESSKRRQPVIHVRQKRMCGIATNVPCVLEPWQQCVSSVSISHECGLLVMLACCDWRKKGAPKWACVELFDNASFKMWSHHSCQRKVIREHVMTFWIPPSDGTMKLQAFQRVLPCSGLASRYC